MLKKIIPNATFIPSLNIMAISAAAITLLTAIALVAVLIILQGIITFAFCLLHYLFTLVECMSQLYVAGPPVGQMMLLVISLGVLTLIAFRLQPQAIRG